MGAISESLGQGVEIIFKDKHYSLAPWDLSIQGAFEKYIEAEIVAGARKMAALLPVDEGSAVLARTAEKIGLKRYTFGTPEIGEALSSPTHMKYMFYLMMKKRDPVVTRELIEEMAKDRDMWDQLLKASNRANGADSDPNDEMADGATTTPNLPSSPA